MRKFEIMTTQQVRELSSPQWLIADLIPEHSTSQLFGREGSHKSFVTLDMAFCVATGKSFHGHEVQQGRVLYVAAEGGASIGQRIRAWEQHSLITTEDVDFFMKEELLLDDPTSVDEALQTWSENSYRLVIIDTLRTSSLGDEMSNKTMGEITRGMRRLQRELNTTVLIVHHSIKSNAKVYGGSNVLAANIATSIRVSFDEPGPTLLECMKQKDAEKFETIVLNHKPVGESLVMTREKAANLSAKRPRSDETILEVLKNYPEGIIRSELIAEVVAREMSAKTAYKRLTVLEHAGALRLSDNKLYPI